MKPAGYLAAGALAAYLVVLVAVILVVPGLLVIVLIGTTTGVLGVAVGIGSVICVQSLILEE